MWGPTVKGAKSPGASGSTNIKPPVAPPSTTRNARERELEQLRQRGLARALNKHFSAVTAEIAKERAEAEAALRDLERRRANTADFQPGNYERTPWDSMYRELQQKKSECKRKEKETLLLYQRYVNKFGDSGYVALPEASGSGKAYSGFLPPTTPTVKRDIQPSSVPVSDMSASIEGQLEENTRRGADRLPSAEIMGFEKTVQSATTKANKQSKTLNMRLLEARGVDSRASPSPTKQKRQLSSEAPMTPSLSETAVSDKADVGYSARDAKAPDLAYSGTGNAGTGTKSSDEGTVLPGASEISENRDSDEDTRSIVSGLTSVNSQTIAAEVDLRLLEFLKTETIAIRQMMDESSVGGDDNRSVASMKSAGTSYSSKIGSQSQKAALRAEEMVMKMKKMVEDFENESIISGSVATETKPAYPYELKTRGNYEKWMVYYDEQYKREYYHEIHSNVVQWNKPESATRKSRRVYDDSGADVVRMADYSKAGGRNRSRAKKQALITHDDVRPEVAPRAVTGGSTTTEGVTISRRDMYRLKMRKKRRRRRIAAAGLLVTIFLGLIYFISRYSTDSQFSSGVDRAITAYVPSPIVSTTSRAIDSTNSVIRQVVTSSMSDSSQEYLPEAWTGLQARRDAAARAAETKQQEAERLRKEKEAETLRIKKEKEAALKKQKQEEEERKRKEKEAAIQKAKEEAERKERERKEKERLEKERKEKERKEKLEKERMEKERLEKERLEKERLERLEQERLERERLEKERQAALKEKQEMERKAKEEEELRRAREEAERAKAVSIAERLYRPTHCNVPLAYLFNGRCMRLSHENPVFEVESFAMLQ